MRTTLRRALLAVGTALLLPALLAAQSSPSEEEYLALGRKYFDWLIAGRADSLVAHMTPESREASGGVEGMNRRILDFLSRAGNETELVVEKMTRRRGNPQYWRESRYSTFTEDALVFRWVFNTAGEIQGIGITPASQAPPPD